MQFAKNISNQCCQCWRCIQKYTKEIDRLLLPETMKENSTYRAKVLRWEVNFAFARNVEFSCKFKSQLDAKSDRKIECRQEALPFAKNSAKLANDSERRLYNTKHITKNIFCVRPP